MIEGPQPEREPSVTSAPLDRESAVPLDQEPAITSSGIFPIRPGQGSRVPSWFTGLRQEIDRSRAALLSVTEAQSDEDRALRDEIIRQLDAADSALHNFVQRNWLARLVSAAAVYEETTAIVQVASEDLLLVEDDALVQARLPSLRAGIKAYLGASDPRFDEYTQLIDSIGRSSENDKGETSDRRPSSP